MLRSLSRGLDILTLLNKCDSVTPAELSRELAIPRATVYRILDTLTDKGFIYQHKSDKRFRMTDMVRALSDGFTDEDHMANISRDFLNDVTRQLVWPVSLATISGIDLIVRENTDKLSPLAVEQFTIGYRMPILNSASGICILAFMDAVSRDVILNMLAQVKRKQDQLVHNRRELEKMFKKVCRQGYAVHHRHRNISDMTAIAVPIRAQERVRGALTVRYARTALPLHTAVEKFVPVVTKAADALSRRLTIHLEKQLNNS